MFGLLVADGAPVAVGGAVIRVTVLSASTVELAGNAGDAWPAIAAESSLHATRYSASTPMCVARERALRIRISSGGLSGVGTVGRSWEPPRTIAFVTNPVKTDTRRTGQNRYSGLADPKASTMQRRDVGTADA